MSTYPLIHHKHQGRPINKLQNAIILLIFKIWKIRNIGFIRNLILNNSCEFYYDDVTVTSFVHDNRIMPFCNLFIGRLSYNNNIL